MKPILKDISMRLHPTSESGLFNPRVLVAFVLCSLGVFLGIFSLAATPRAEVARRNTSAPPTLFRPGQMAAGFAPKANALPPGVPLPSGMASVPRDPLRAPFSVNQQIDSSSSGPTADSSTMPQSSATAPSWSIFPSPNGGATTTFLSAVTCVTASDCWAVGRTDDGYSETVLMRWDGDSWKVVPSPSVEKAANGLVDITCLSSSSCWAVGYQITVFPAGVHTLVQHWDGTSWQIIPSANAATGFSALYGVACTSDTDCWAVGFHNSGSLAQTLIERWDGTSWQIVSSPNVGSDHNVLAAVTCLSASDCRAVGYTGVEGATNAVVAQWNGTAWTSSALPQQPNSQEDLLRSVTCNSTSDCWAVGDSYDGVLGHPLIERWDGTSWTSALAPNGAADNYLFRVACSSASDCWAVGRSNNATIDPELFDQDLILHWNGSDWSANTALIDPTATYASDLAGVACSSGSECWAVGSIRPTDLVLPHIIRWDGTSWVSVVAPDVPPILPSNELDAVTCLSATDCWAAGEAFYGSVARSLTMHWDGIAWEIMESPNTAIDRSNYLTDITCASSSDCWTVGWSANSNAMQDQALAMHWDGAAWSIVSTSPVETSDEVQTALEGVTCVSSSDCWAVGHSENAVDFQALIQHWNGVSWIPVPAPPPQNDPAMNTYLYDVACTTTSDCTAVGIQWTSPFTGNSLYQTLVEHWDGISWSIVASPNTATDQSNSLSAVTCVSASDCWAVGSFDDYSQALIEHWNGTSWSIVASPADHNLSDVTCLSASDCWAAGPWPDYTPNTSAPPVQTVVVHWDGASWSKVISPNTSTTRSNNLSGIACPSSSDCWAVGLYWPKGTPKTLTLHYTANPPPIPTSVVSRKTHGTAGTFDVDLSLYGSTGIECRSGGANGDYALVFVFANPLANIGNTSLSSGTGTVASANIDSTDPHNYIVNLTGVTNAQVITVNLTNLTDSNGNFYSSVSVPMGVLVGDVNASKAVTSGDTNLCKAQALQPVTIDNFRTDINASGAITTGDVNLIKQNALSQLPTPP